MLLNKEQLIYFSFRLFFVVIECLFLTYLLCFVLFFFQVWIEQQIWHRISLCSHGKGTVAF